MMTPIRWVEGGLEILCKDCGTIFVEKNWSQAIICPTCNKKPAVMGDAPATEEKMSIVRLDNDSSEDGEKT